MSNQNPRDEKKPPIQTQGGSSEENMKAILPDYGKYSYLKVPFLIKLNLLMFVVALSSTNTGYDGSLLNSLQTMDDWANYMGNPTGAVLGALSNGVTFGVILSFPVASQISDYLGRRHAILIGNIIMMIGVILQSCTQNYAMFLVARIILGVGNGIAIVPSPTLMSELSYPSHREVITTFYNTCWYLGAVIAAWVSYGTRNVSSNWCWRIPSICQGAMPLLQTLFIYLVPESPRWFISKGRVSDARKVLLKYHGNNNEAIAGPLVDFEMAEISAAIEAEQISNQFSYKDLFKTPGNRKRMFLIFFVATGMQLSGNGLVSFYLNLVLNSIGITSTSEKLVVNGGLMIYNFGIALIIASNVYRFKRRVMFLTSFSLMLLFYIIWTVLSAINQQRDFEQKSLGQGVLAMIFLYYLAFDIGFNGLPLLYTTELLPFTIRTKGVNVLQVVEQLWCVYNGFVNPVAMDAIEWKYYIVYCCILAVELLVCYFTYVETSGKTLEEVAEVFGETPGDINRLQYDDSAKLDTDHLDHRNTRGSDMSSNV